MMFAPTPQAVALVIVQQLIWLPFIAVLAILRAVTTRGWRRGMSLLALAICAAGIGARTVEALGYTGVAAIDALAWRISGTGPVWLLPLLASAALATTIGGSDGRLGKVLHGVHGIAALSALGLWAVVRLG
ncbi:MAG: hypothetical protein ACU0BF_02000 [Paracoccaceae bacterium]